MRTATAQFLDREARLLDECRFRDCLNLLTDDVRDRMPVMGRRYRAFPQFADAKLASMKTVRVPGAGGHDIPGYLTLPPGKPRINRIRNNLATGRRTGLGHGDPR